MKRVAALYDIHGNLPALEAVLSDARGEGVDAVVVGGDVVPGPLSRETLDALLGLDLPTSFLRGNGESDVLSAHQGRALERVPERFRDAIRLVAAELHEEALRSLAAWPLTHEAVVVGRRVLFCHATPRDDNEIFTRRTDSERLRPLFDPLDADVVVCGHTHMQFDRTVGSTRVVNAGSVGMPFGDTQACWALVGAEVELRRTPYDLEAAAACFAGSEYQRLTGFDVRTPPDEDTMLDLFEAAALGGG